MNNSTPAWFQRAIDTPYQTHTVTVDDCPIVYQTWGDPARPGLLFLHGNGAHAHWWDFIAPGFCDDYYVVASNLSGMGDSGHRDHYESSLYVKEIKAVCDAAGFSNKPVLVGHSLGGRLVLSAEKHYPDAFTGIVMADSPFHPPDKELHFQKRRAQPVKPHKVYASLEEALGRFRLFPAQPCDNDYIVDYIARHSLKEVNGGWQWKFDPKTYSRLDFENLLSSLPAPDDKIWALIYGEDSELFPEKTVRYNQQLFADAGLPPLIKLPGAYHHLFLDQPLAFIETVQSILKQAGYGD